MSYLPPLIPQLDGSPFAGTNCGLARLAMAILDHHAGKKPADLDPDLTWPPTPASLRTLSGDTSGGTRLSQHVLLAWRYGMHLETRYGVPFDDVYDEAESTGKAICLDGAYSGLPRQYRGSETFLGNHGVLVIPGEGTWDPLCDGRRPGIPDGPQDVPRTALRLFAAALMLESGTRLGFGRCYAGLYEAGAVSQPVIPIELGGNPMMVLTPGDLSARKRKSVKKGTPIHREPGGPVVTRMSKDARIPYVAYAGSVDGVGYQAVMVGTSNFPDHQSRTIIGYARFDAGPVA